MLSGLVLSFKPSSIGGYSFFTPCDAAHFLFSARLPRFTLPLKVLLERSMNPSGLRLPGSCVPMRPNRMFEPSDVGHFPSLPFHSPPKVLGPLLQIEHGNWIGRIPPSLCFTNRGKYCDFPFPTDKSLLPIVYLCVTILAHEAFRF